MRLTLRNLLAYLHGLMSPDDKGAFEALMQNSPRIQTLVDRCRALPKQRHLHAPAVEQSSPLHTAEAISNYLDFTLPDEQVAAFEKAALASDEQLSEIVACHQALAALRDAQPAAVEHPALRSRLLDLAAKHSAATAEMAREVAAGSHGAAAPKATEKAAQQVGAGSLGDKANNGAMQDSGDLTTYLSDVDDDEELSLDAAEGRRRQAEQQAVAAAASAYATGTATASPPAPGPSRLTTYGTKDPYKKENTKVPDALTEKKEPSKAMLLGGLAGGVVLVLVVVVWGISALASMFSGGGGGRPVAGPTIYGVEPGGRVTTELKGKISYQPSGASPSADAGAMIVAWPAGSKVTENKLTANRLLENLSAQRQDPYNEYLVIGKADDDGNYHLRMLEGTEFHVMVLSQRSQLEQPKVWGDAITELKSHVADPATLVGKRNYIYQKVPMPSENVATFDHTFTE